jgi:hypothetical protein
VPSGIWHAEEYEKLPRYDEELIAQPVQAFYCHQGDNHVCSGWLGYHDPAELLAVRIGISAGRLDPSVIDYTTDVPLFESGAEAAEHGMQDIEFPSGRAQRAIEKITKVRSAPGREPLR